MVRDFLKAALAGKAGVQFQVPPGITLVTIDAKTGQRASPGTPNAITEAFKTGSAPATSYSMLADPDGQTAAVPPESERAISSGTGGLY